MADFLTGLNQGLQTGIDLAMKQEELQAKRDAIALQKQQHDLQKGEWAMGEIRDIVSVPKELRKVRIATFENQARIAGITVSPETKTILQSEDLSPKVIEALNGIDSLQGAEKFAALTQLSGLIGTDKAYKFLQESEDRKAAQARADIQAAGQAGRLALQEAREQRLDEQFQKKFEQDQRHFEAKLEADKTKQNDKVLKELAQAQTNLDEDSRPVRMSLQNLEKVAAQPGPLSSEVVIGLLQPLREGKVSVLREGERAGFRAATDLSGRVENFFGRIIKGNQLNEAQKREAIQLARISRNTLDSLEKDLSQRNLIRARAKELPVDQVFSPRQLQLLGVDKSGNPIPQKAPAQPARPAQQRTAPKPQIDGATRAKILEALKRPDIPETVKAQYRRLLQGGQ